MSSAFRPNRVADDAEIIRLNSLGYSQGTVAKKLKCHSTTIALRLKSLGVPPSNTRRSFMEDILNQLQPNLINKLANKLGPTFTVKDYVHGLILKDLLKLKESE